MPEFNFTVQYCHSLKWKFVANCKSCIENDVCQNYDVYLRSISVYNSFLRNIVFIYATCSIDCQVLFK